MIIPDESIVDSVINSLGKPVEELSIREINIAGNQIQKLMQEKCSSFRISALNMGIPGLETPKIMVEAQKTALAEGRCSDYAPFDGVPRLKEASSAYVKKAYCADVEPTNHIPTPGAMMGCELAIKLAGLMYPGNKKEIITLDPGFSVNYTQIRQLGGQRVPLELRVRGKELAELIEDKVSEGNISAVMWSSPNNPTWLMLTDEEYFLLAGIADRHDVLLIHDAAYGPMDFENNTGRIPSPISRTENAVLLYSASKMMSYAGERVGIFAAHDSLMKRKVSKTGNTVWNEIVQEGLYARVASVPHSAQHGFAAGLEKELEIGDFIRSHCLPYKVQGKALKNAFLESGFEIAYSEPDGTLGDGFYFTVAREGCTSNEIIFGLLRCGISAVPLDIFGVKRDGARICASLMATYEDKETVKERLGYYGVVNS